MIHLIPGFNLWEIRSLLGNSSFGIQYLDILGKDSTGDDNGNKTGFVGTWNPNSSISLEAAYYDYLNYVVGLSGSGQICNFSLDGQISYTVLDTGFYDTNWYNANLTATLPLSSRSNVFLNLLKYALSGFVLSIL